MYDSRTVNSRKKKKRKKIMTILCAFLCAALLVSLTVTGFAEEVTDGAAVSAQEEPPQEITPLIEEPSGEPPEEPSG